MIADVTMDKTSFQPVPERFEAGSQAVAQIHAWAVALDYLQEVGMERIRSHELALTQYLLEGLATVKGLRLLGPADYREGSVWRLLISRGFIPMTSVKS